MTGPATSWFTPTILEGEVVRLEPMSLDHLDGLIEAGRDPRIWTWMPNDGSSPAGMRELVEAALAARDARTQIPFVTIVRATGLVVGSSRYLAPAPADLRVEIGWTWLDPAVQRTAVNTEAKLLMLGHAFDTLGCRRVELKTDALNDQSRTAILGIGATFEGIFRKHMVMPGGRARDSAYYSIVDDEWPAIRKRLQARLERHRSEGRP
jgi:N-acetyltransferase